MSIADAPVSETICPDCGERNGGRVEFCSACGAFLAWDGDTDDTPAPPSQQPAGDRAAPSGHTRSGPLPGVPTGPSLIPSGPPATGQPATRSFSGPPVGPPTGVQQFRAQPAGPPTGSYRQGSPPQYQQNQGYPPGPQQGQNYQQGPPQQPYTPPAPPPPPTESACPRCGVVNEAVLRFCRKCGLSLKGPTLHDDGLGLPQAPPERLPWWRRWFKPAENTKRAARAAYRHSLPLRYRLMRYLFALLGIGAIVGGLTLIGQNPVRWVTDRINDLQGSLVQVQGVQAYSDPDAGSSGTIVPPTGTPTSGSAAPTTALPAADTAPNVLDNLSDTAWSTAWTASSAVNPVDAPCVSPSAPAIPGSAGSVLLVPEGSVTVREISVAAGLSKDDSRRMLQYRPRTVQLAFSDGRCQQITLTDTDELQQHKIEPVETSQIRLSVIDAYPPATDQPTDQVAISEIRLFERP